MSGEDDGEAPYSIVIDDPTGPRARAPTDTAAPAAPATPRRAVPPEIIVRRSPADPDDTGPLLILRPTGAPPAPARAALDRGETPPMGETLPVGEVTAPELGDAPTPTTPVPAHVSGPFGPPIPVDSSPPVRGRAPSTPGRRPLPREPSRPRPGARPVRDYPVLRGLVREPDAQPDDRPISAAVPRAFVRASPQVEPRSSARAEVDGMLEEMAEGLLVGGDGAGNSEIRVTLGEEFFGGTELRIQRSADGVTAILRPPDRETYRILAAELPRLRVHLEERGLRVSNLRVEEP